MDVADRHAQRDGCAILDGILRHLDQFVIERLFEPVILLDQVAPPHVARHRRVIQHCGEVDALGLPVRDVFALHEAIHAADHFVYGAESELRHDLPQVFRDEEKEIDHVLGLAHELLAEFRVLRRHAHRTRIQVALAHHDAAHRNQRHRGKSEFLRAQ